jgi:hypothetical protein
LYRVSVGCVFGCRLADGRDVIIKAYQPRWQPAFLAGVRHVQHHMWRQGFPFPQPIGDVFAIRSAPAVAEALLPDPGVSLVEEGVLEVSAAGLADQIARCRDLDEPRLLQHPLRPSPAGVFPQPHSPVFDFAATADGATWIDDIAVRALAVRDAVTSPEVIAHTDWSLRNIRIGHGGLLAVYDADSLAVVPEHHAVGQAAATWRNDGVSPNTPPEPAELDRYLDAYGRARGLRLTDEERRGAVAAAVWNLAYIARCEHAIDPRQERLPGTRRWLRSEANPLLAP